MTQIEASRLDDFRKILTFNIVTKIKHSLNGNYQLFYNIPAIWIKWRDRQLTQEEFKQLQPYKLIAIFNSIAFDKLQLKYIFGKIPMTSTQISYTKVLPQALDIKQYNHGTLTVKGRVFHFAKKYLVEYNLVQKIFEDKLLLSKVCNVKSDYYSVRQRKLIFSQILNKKKKKYKTNEQIKAEMTAEQLIEGIEL